MPKKRRVSAKKHTESFLSKKNLPLIGLALATLLIIIGVLFLNKNLGYITKAAQSCSTEIKDLEKAIDTLENTDIENQEYKSIASNVTDKTKNLKECQNALK